jgi:predicted enzyme related to lactoylglutathione lyase
MEDAMKLTFVYAPVRDLGEALTFYRDTLGLTEAWREGDTTVAFELPDSDVQLMVDRADDNSPPGPMYVVDSVADFFNGQPGLKVTMPIMEIPDGHLAGFADPSGNTIYVLDQTGAAAG